MQTQQGLSWDHKTGRHTAVLAIVALVATLFAGAAGPARAGDTTPIDVIVRETAPATDAAERLVERLGGVVGDNLGVIGGFSATIPGDAFEVIQQSPAIESATPDGTVQLAAAGWDDATALSNVDFRNYSGSLYGITRTIKATNAWGKGYTGYGIDVALIDTGVAPVHGLSPWKVANGPDLSFESQNPELQYLDSNGHGTHMAGIIAGIDIDLGSISTGSNDSYSFVGVAPGSRIVNVKVGAHDGSVDVSQVIAAIDWVVQHGQDPGFNIRVLNLAFGTDATQSYLLDPLAYAVEQAWKSGIVVVVAAGNDGNDSGLRNPAIDPFVMAVGSGYATNFNADANNPVVYDSLSDFSNCGTTQRTVDILAPGKSITSLRTPGSYADLNNPRARVGTDFFLGSGTSQAAAVVSGAAALVLDAWPTLTPDEVKHLLTSSATGLSGVSTACQGAGMINLDFLSSKRAPSTGGSAQTFEPSTGSGTLEGARGTHHIEMDGVPLMGERDIMGSAWIGFNEIKTECVKSGKGRFATTTCTDTLIPVSTLWYGGDWNGRSWSGTSWSGDSWSGLSWSGTSWSGTSWSGTSWSGLSWSDQSWSGLSWSGTSWSGTSWSGTSWSGLSWSSGGRSDASAGLRWD